MLEQIWIASFVLVPTKFNPHKSAAIESKNNETKEGFDGPKVTI